MYDLHWLSGGFVWLFWILIFAVIVWLWRFNYQDTGEKKSALDLLKERYARGEIIQEEFEDKKRHLSR